MSPRPVSVADTVQAEDCVELDAQSGDQSGDHVTSHMAINKNNRESTLNENAKENETGANYSDSTVSLETTQVRRTETSVNDSVDAVCDARDEDGDETSEVKLEPEEDKAPDGGWGWMIVAGCLLLRMVIGGLGRSHGLFYIKFRERFEGSATATAFVTSLTGFVRLSGGPFVSILCSRFACRKLTSIGAGTLVLGLLLTRYAPSLEFLYFSYGVIAGLGRAFSLTPCPILLGYYFNKRRSLAFGLASAGFSIGGFAITPLVELLFQNYGFQGTFLILSGFATHIFVSSALFRPIELHRKLIAKKGTAKSNTDEKLRLTVRSIENLESGAVLGSSTISIDRIPRNTNERYQSKALRLRNHNEDIHGTSIKQVSKEQNEALLKDTNTEYHVAEDDKVNVQLDEEHGASETDTKQDISDKTDSKNKKKKKWISLSILKDVRFLCFVFAMFCFTLPSSGLFLPALAKTRGLTDLQAATLLSMNAGFDTVFRVIAGFVLDMKIFREHRPMIYNFITFIQGILMSIYPSLTSFTAFMTLCAFDGAVQGVKQAQGSVVMMDMLGVDKFASSLAVTMSVQGIAVVIGPTISGQLKDRFGTYDGAFYFGASAIIMGGLVMAVGNLRKLWMDRQKKELTES